MSFTEEKWRSRQYVRPQQGDETMSLLVTTVTNHEGKLTRVQLQFGSTVLQLMPDDALDLANLLSDLRPELEGQPK